MSSSEIPSEGLEYVSNNERTGRPSQNDGESFNWSTHSMAVVGGGLVGRLVAWRLARMGAKVMVFDEGNRRQNKGAAWVAAGMIAPWSESPDTSPKLVEMGIRSLQLWADWVVELQGDSQQDVELLTEGTIIVAHQLDRSQLEFMAQQIARTSQAGDWQYLNDNDWHHNEPLLSHFRNGWRLPKERVLDNRQILLALGEALTNLDVPWQQDKAMKKVDLIELQKQFDVVIDCRGLGAKDTVSHLRGVRGEVVRVRAPGVELRHAIRLVHPRYQLYIAPRREQQFVIGATSIESESMEPISVRSTMELLSALTTVSPHFFEAQILEASAHCRPALPDHEPRVYADRRYPKLWMINGLYRHGFMIAPAVVEYALAKLAIHLTVQH